MANNWEHFCFTTGFQDMSDRQLRHLTRQMTYPMTVASTLAPMAPQFNYRNDRLTPEGRRSMLGALFS